MPMAFAILLMVNKDGLRFPRSSSNAERRSREAILSQNGESCDWWTYGELNPALIYAIDTFYR